MSADPAKWFQELPNSYKIQVQYQEVPKFVKTYNIDTPFRFSTYEDAYTVGREIFDGIKFHVVGSNDRPHWQSTPIEQAIPETLSKKVWYDLYGISPEAPPRKSKQSKQSTQSRQSKQSNESMTRLMKLKPQVVTTGVIKNN